ncbi:zinc-ribbon domain-containing protein [Paenibacillus abyssi]|uniref:DUF2726 domain-containing protein n=1 Tax=Paenibacillus abyssi TaxID=1340531 RepID=A0A917CJH8_9BACL|nr:zinc-ribbon domain-containing protein [Paenibacillus abyssi]GGF88422.1 hypothetical protein GCM10010916_02210 [Paenibacillus abyssi]
MAIWEEYVEVTVGCRNNSHYEALGYVIPRRRDKQGRLAIPRGTKITVKISDLPAHSNVKLTKVCDECSAEVANQSYNMIMRERREGKDRCKECSYERMRVTKLTSTPKAKSFGHKFPELISYWHPDNELSPFDVRAHTVRKFKFICENDESHDYTAEVRNVVNGQRCGLCAMPKGERRIHSYLSARGIPFTQQATMDGLVGTGGGALMFDFVIHNRDGKWLCAVEYDGKQHFEPVDFLGKGMREAQRNLKIQQEHDRRKEEFCKHNAIPLLRIKYTQFDDIETILSESLPAIRRQRAAFYIAN